MKKITIAALSVAFFISSCSNAEQVRVVKDNPAFTSTQKYQIMVWNIKKAENYVPYTYRCQANKKTIGWGFTNVKSIKNIHHADIILKDLIEDIHNDVKKEYPKLTYLQQAVIVSLVYNTGDLNGVKNSNFSKALTKNQINKAVKHFKDWNKVKVRKGRFIVSKGLVNRRNYETKLLDGSFTMNDYHSLKAEVDNIYKRNKS